MKAKAKSTKSKSVTQPQKKAKAKNTEGIDISPFIKFNTDKLADIIKQIESVSEGLKILVSEVKAN